MVAGGKGHDGGQVQEGQKLLNQVLVGPESLHSELIDWWLLNGVKRETGQWESYFSSGESESIAIVLVSKVYEEEYDLNLVKVNLF